MVRATLYYLAHDLLSADSISVCCSLAEEYRNDVFLELVNCDLMKDRAISDNVVCVPYLTITSEQSFVSFVGDLTKQSSEIRSVIQEFLGI